MIGGRPMARRVILTIALVMLCAARARAADAASVERSISKAKTYLYLQHHNGSWESAPRQEPSSRDKLTGSQWGGQTALAAYALLAAGDRPASEPKLAQSIDFLKTAKLTGTYAFGLRCMVWLLLPQSAETRSLLKRDAAALQTMMKSSGPAKGFYDYDARGSSYSLSRSQYAVLGMWAAAQGGVEIPVEYWRKTEAAWTGAQEPDGGWRYQRGGRNYPVTPGMTAAGVASLLVAREQLLAARSGPCDGNPPSGAIDRGLAWLDQNFDLVAAEDSFRREYPYVTLYAVERVGVGSGLKHLGRHDWYQKGSDYLVEKQNPDGSWRAADSYFGALPDTCFAMLFLARGRAPLLMNKLQHGEAAETAAVAPASNSQPATSTSRPARPDALTALKTFDTKSPGADWNQRPRDVANLAQWVGSIAERDLNWQVLGPGASLRDFFDAPILYVSGSAPLKLREDTKRKLRAYVEGGGLLLGHADCGGKPFAASFRQLGSELFPRFEFRELPATHPHYTGVFRRDKWKNKPSLLGQSNGVRELTLLLPQADAARAWQSKLVGGKEELWQLGADIFFYAAGRKDLRYRGESNYVEENPSVKPTRELTLARLEYAGNWDPEPGGWRRVAAILHNEHRLKLAVRPLKLGVGKLTKQYPVAHLTGTTDFKLDEPSRNELRTYVQSGGTVLFESAGGSATFTDAADAELKSLFPNAKLEVLPLSHPLYAAGDPPLKEVTYRPYAQKSVVGASRMPLLQALTVNNRPAIFFSREDLSAGLAGQSTDGILGYAPKSATEIMTRLLLYAAGAETRQKRSDKETR
jgi:hypothetical protein